MDDTHPPSQQLPTDNSVAPNDRSPLLGAFQRHSSESSRDRFFRVGGAVLTSFIHICAVSTIVAFRGAWEFVFVSILDFDSRTRPQRHLFFAFDIILTLGSLSVLVAAATVKSSRKRTNWGWWNWLMGHPFTSFLALWAVVHVLVSAVCYMRSNWWHWQFWDWPWQLLLGMPMVIFACLAMRSLVHG
ncbi:hypothetical protein B0H63DRAFT_529101 [Podospora didyma]|uniref:Uncharacterized protein n=1 Tax=Podospora didyma TaxID=330526 RepID=A0AAE0K2E2_9PEZI|nr:hypothetical protein B0H63DRAFT_529101 [Podospora didyma]